MATVSPFPDKELAGDDIRKSAEFGVQEATQQHQTRRGLSPRHVQLMTIAGGIGVGLFVGVGSVLRDAGPLPLFLGYFIYGVFFIWPTCLNVAEMVAWLPVRGSIYELANRFVDPALGFAMGWTYFFAGTMLVCTEYSAVATVMEYWNTSINPAVWIAMSMAICYFLNMVAVKWYGETEFIMSSTKVLLLIGLVMATLVTMAGGNPQNDAYGFRNWSNGDFIHSYYADGATGMFLSICISVRYAVFTMPGPDMIALAAGEIRNPRKTIPNVARMVLARVFGIYLIGVLAVGILCNSRDARLLGAIASGQSGAAASPWVVGLLNLGIEGFLPGFINFLILLSGLSCGNAFLYSSSRTLYSLAQDGQAPKIFLECTEVGVPWVAVTAITVISCLSFLVASNGSYVVFSWFVGLTTVSLCANFTAKAWVFIGWRRALKAQGYALVGKNNINQRPWLSKLVHSKPPASEITEDTIVFPYIAPCGTWTPYMNLFLGSTVCIFIGFDVFAPFSYRGLITNYFGLLWFCFMFLFWKVYKKTKFVVAADVDIYAAGRKQAVDEECRHWEDGSSAESEYEQLKQVNVFVRGWKKFWGN
ncbi:amino acid permease-domain-containing protein [Ilyonectria robusta]|uniref:amino acid permease-domain-containing protein n=1 Tax=Ilyonectria robusta TaxID=1079257 RepID=UPI001E8CF398|nr:amino acid permease-domain-containing protein [Ilyonectria robusta]KAH8656827.1 amino acid permease-domain-containing protein [Ilyonectria robusta]